MSTPATVTVTRNAASPVLLSPNFLGVSIEQRSFYTGLYTGTATAAIAIHALLGPSLIRCNCNGYTWNSAGAGGQSGGLAPSDIDKFAAFVRALPAGTQITYAIPMTNSGNAVNSVSNAVAEATYVAGAMGSYLLAFAIGNEPELYSATWATFSAYFTQWQAIAAAVRSALPGISLIGPSAQSPYNNTTQGLATYVAQFAAGGTAVKKLTGHYYQQYASEGVGALVSWPAPILNAMVANGVAQAKANGIPQFRVDEMGSDITSANGVTNSLGSALWVIDSAFAIAQSGGSGVNVHYYLGDTTSGFSCLIIGSNTITAIQPEFLGMLLFSQAAKGQLFSTTTSGVAQDNLFSDPGFLLTTSTPWTLSYGSTVTVKGGPGGKNAIGGRIDGAQAGAGAIGVTSNAISVSTGDTVSFSIYADFSANMNTGGLEATLIDQNSNPVSGTQVYWGATYAGYVNGSFTIPSGVTSVSLLANNDGNVTCAIGKQALFSDPLIQKNPINFSAYAIGHTLGATNIVLVNKDTARTITTTVALGAPATTASVLTLTGASLGATSGITLGGTTVSTSGAWSPTTSTIAVNGSSFSIDVPPTTAMLISAQPAATLPVTKPARLSSRIGFP